MKAQVKLRASASSPALMHSGADRTARAVPLPHQALMVARFGGRAAHVPVVIGPAVAASLRKRGAAAASLDGIIVLPHERVGPDLVAHEVAHALQQRAGGADPAAALADAMTLAARVAHAPVVPEANRSEAEARRGERAAGAVVSPQVALPPGVLSLRRIGDVPTADVVPGAPVPARPAEPAPMPAAEAVPAVGAPAATAGPQPAASDIAPTFTPPDFVEPTLDPAIAAERAAAADAARAALAAADSPEAVMAAYGGMAPSQQALIQPELGARLASAAAMSNGKLGDATPAIAVESRGGEGALPMPTPVGVPADSADIDLAPAPDAVVVVPEGPPQPLLQVDPTYGPQIERRFTDSATAERVDESIDAVSVSNPGIVTEVADRATVPRDRANDPQRLDDALASQRAQSSQLRQQAALAVISGPGPELVVPRALNASAPAPAFPGPELEGLKPSPEAQQLGTMGLPDTVIASFDQATAPQMGASAGQARQQMADARTVRDIAHDTAAGDAETQRHAAEQNADGAQRKAVGDQRTAIQEKRQDTVDTQNRRMAEVNGEAAHMRGEKRKEAQDEVDASQRRIDDRYNQAERDAAAKVREAEEKAERERQRKKKEAAEASWWDRAVNFIRDAFDALVSLVNDIFDAVRSVVTGLIDLARRAVADLIEAVASVLKSIVSALGTILKGLVDGLIGQIFPELARALDEAIDGAVNAVNHAIDTVATVLTDAVIAIAAALTKAVNALLDVFQGAINAAMALLEAAITGDWGALLLKVLDAVLSVLGIDPAAFHALIDQAADAVSIIVNDPGQFVSNMIDVVVGGVQRFADHFPDHLRRGVIAWLTGALGDIQLPDEWNLWTVLDLARQVLGLTWDFVRERAAKIIGPENVARIEAMAGWIGTLITEGWQGLWTRIQASIETLKESVLSAIRSFVMERVILAAITWLASLFNPVGALVKLVMTIWNIYQFVSGQLQRLFGIVQAVVGAISNVAHGVLEPGMQAIEAVLGSLVPVVIDLLMSLLGVTGVAAGVREIIKDVRETIAGAIDALLQRVLQTLGLGKKPGAEDAPVAEGGGVPLGHPVAVADHVLSVERAGTRAAVMLSGPRHSVSEWLDQFGQRAQLLDAVARPAAEASIGEARAALGRLQPAADRAGAAPPVAAGTGPSEIDALEDRLGQSLGRVFDTVRGAVPAAAAGGTLLQEGLSMDGEPHTLRLVAENGEIRLEMASVNFTQIKRTVTASEATARSGGKRDLANALRRLLNRNIDTYEIFVGANLNTLLQPNSRDYASASAAERRQFGEILQGAIDIGARFGVKSLSDLGHPSRYVLNDEIRAEYRAYPAWRDTFYKAGWSSAIDPGWKATEFAKLNNEALTAPQWATHAYVTNPASRPNVFVVRDANGQFPSTPYLDVRRPGNVHIDHKQEVADHFQTQGNSWKQPPREKWYELLSNLQLLNDVENGRKSTATRVTSWHVTTAFRGPGEP